jgi:site-specific DNA-cytosine methylase
MVIMIDIMKKRVTSNQKITAQPHIQTIAIISLMMFMFFSCALEAPQQEDQKKEEKKALIDTLTTQIDTSESTTLQRQSLTNLEEHVRQQSFHDLFTQTHYHTKVFIDRYTGQETARLQRYPDHPQEKRSADTLDQTYYQIGELELTTP